MKKLVLITGLLLGCTFLLFSSCEPDPLSGYGQLNAKVDYLKFFESSPDLVPHGQREYDTFFHPQTSRFICYELGLSYGAPGRRVDFTLDVVYYNPDGSQLHRLDHNTGVEANWTGSFHSNGVGWDAPGNWQEGVYTVEIYEKHSNNLIATDSFVISSESGQQGGIFLEPRQPDGTVSGMFLDSQDAEIQFSVSPDGTAVFDYRNGQVSVMLTSELSPTREAEVYWNGVTLNGKGYLSVRDKAELEELFNSGMGESLALIALEAGCLPDNEIDPEQLAALLVPFQLALKYLYPDRRERVLELAEKTSCNYFDDQSYFVKGSGLMFSPSGLFPYVFGFFPFDEHGAVEGVQSRTIPYSVRWQSPYENLLAHSPSFRAFRSILDDENTRRNQYGGYGNCRSKCRGACGANCPDTCEHSEETSCVKIDGENTGDKLVWDIYKCGVHRGCIEHDKCYDDAINRHGCNTWRALYEMHGVDWITEKLPDFQTHPGPYSLELADKPYEDRSCDSKGIYDHGLRQAYEWVRGRGPFEDHWVFAYIRGEDDPDYPGVYDPIACPPSSARLTIIPDQIPDARTDVEYTFELLAENIQDDVPGVTRYVNFEWNFGDLQTHGKGISPAISATADGTAAYTISHTYRSDQFLFGRPESTLTVIVKDSTFGDELARATAQLSFYTVAIQGNRTITYTLPADGRTETTLDFEAVASPDGAYRFVWNFDDGSPVVTDTPPFGQSSKVSHDYKGLKDGDIFRPRVELRSLDGQQVLATDSVRFDIEGKADDDSETVTIGTQVWMKKNLNIATGNSKCFDDDPANCAIYGRLYDWETALTVCPPGWRLPSDADWKVLTDYLGGSSVAGGKMKSISSLWNSPNIGATNESGFSGLPTGANSGGSFFWMGMHAIWWSSTEGEPSPLIGSIDAWAYRLSFASGEVERLEFRKVDRSSVRCLRE